MSYKLQNAEFKKKLETSAAKLNGILVCFKKAYKGIAWLKHESLPAILVVNWREAKPCWDLITVCPVDCCLLALVTYYSAGSSSRRRANKWSARKTTMNFPVFACCSEADLDQSLVESLKAILVPTKPCPGLMPNNVPPGNGPLYVLEDHNTPRTCSSFYAELQPARTPQTVEWDGMPLNCYLQEPFRASTEEDGFVDQAWHLKASSPTETASQASLYTTDVESQLGLLEWGAMTLDRYNKEDLGCLLKDMASSHYED